MNFGHRGSIKLLRSIWAKAKPLWEFGKLRDELFLFYIFFQKKTLCESTRLRSCRISSWRVNSRRYAWPFFYSRTNKAHQSPRANCCVKLVIKWYWCRRCGRTPRRAGRPQATSAGIPSSPFGLIHVSWNPNTVFILVLINI